MNKEFKESQKFTQWWLWLIILSINILPLFGIYKQIILGEPFGDKPVSDVGLFLLLVLTAGISFLFYFMQLKTTVSVNGIKMSFIPFANKDLSWNEIKSTKVLNYGFVGGWGIRLFTKYGTVYNTKGKMGLAIVLRNGNKFMIGTQKPKELEEFISSLSPQ